MKIKQDSNVDDADDDRTNKSTMMASPSVDVEPTPPVSASAAALPWSCDVRTN